MDIDLSCRTPRRYHLRRSPPRRGTKRSRRASTADDNRHVDDAGTVVRRKISRRSSILSARIASIEGKYPAAKRRKILADSHAPRLKRFPDYLPGDELVTQRPHKRRRQSGLCEECCDDLLLENYTICSEIDSSDVFDTDFVLDVSGHCDGKDAFCNEQCCHNESSHIQPHVQSALLESGEVLISVTRPDGSLQRVILAPPGDDC